MPPTNNTVAKPVNSFSTYLDKRSLRIFCLGISSGFPWVLIGSMLSLWLKDAGLSRSTIGFAGAIFAVYSINFLWSPLVDRVRLPLLGALGQRRSWILLTQLTIACLCLLISASDPELNLQYTVLLCLFVAISSATQDIAIDAYRIDSLPENNSEMLTTGAAMATAGWWTGYAGIGFIPLWLSDGILAWPQVYCLMAVVPVLLALITLLSPEPPQQQRTEVQQQAEQSYLRAIPSVATSRKYFLLASLIAPIALTAWAFSGFQGLGDGGWVSPTALLTGVFLLIIIGWQLAQLDRVSAPHHHANQAASALDIALAWLLVTLAQPIKDFFSRTGVKAAFSLLLFIFLFKIGEAFLGRMSIVFYKEIGFTNTDIGTFSKLMSWWVTIVFSFVGGWFTLKQGILKGLFIGGIAMSASNLLFALMAIVGPSKELFAFTVLIDGFTTAWSTVAFVAFISLMCSRNFTATQYALLASLGNLGRTVLSSGSGLMIDGLNGNWPLFFCITALMVVPALALLWWAKDDIQALENQ